MSGCTEHTIEVNGVRLCWWEWGAQHRREGTILLVHATGFHARCWDQTVKTLSGRHVIAIDMRGHGRSEKRSPYTWETFGRDLTKFVSALDLDRVIGAGHSMGGHSLTQAVAADQSRFDAMVLVDPVILLPEAYENFKGYGEPDDHPVSRRRNQFQDAADMMEGLRGRGNFGVWQPEVFEDYCTHGIVPNPEGVGMVLACPPIVEATIYTGSAGTNIYPLIEQIDIPVTILRATPRDPENLAMDFAMSPTWPELASRFSNATDVYVPELTHFIPMQAPELVADHILKYAASTDRKRPSSDG